MSRVLVVYDAPEIADTMASHLRAAGFAVEVCTGPDAVACPVLDGLACPLVERADVLVYDAWLVGGPEGWQGLLPLMVAAYPDRPIVISSADEMFIPASPHRPAPVLTVPGLPGGPAIVDAVNRAIGGTRGRAVRARRCAVRARRGPLRRVPA